MMTPRSNRMGAMVVLLACTAAPLGARAELGTFADGELADADWRVEELVDDTVAADAELLGMHRADGGNPGGFRAVSNGWVHDGTDWATVVAGHLRTEAEFAPLVDGELGSVDIALDVVTLQTTYLTEAMLAFFPVLQQGDTYYAAGDAVDSDGSWATAEWLALQASDFTPYAGDLQGPEHPDFTTAGAPLTFGVAAQSGPHQLAGAFFTEGGLDNWSLTLRAPGAGGAGGAGGAEESGGAGGSTGVGAGQGVGANGPGVGPSTLPPREDGCGCRLADARSRAGTTGLAVVWSVLLVSCVRRRRGLSYRRRG